jgi:acetyltransferase-like isoleucine patch superfamily enzyme
MFRKLYLSPLWLLISYFLRLLAFFQKPFMVYGYFNRVTKVYHKHTRIGSNVKLTDSSKIDIDDHVWIGHFCLLDGIGGIKIGKGVNIASHTVIYTHSSQNAIRFLGAKFIEVPANKRPCYLIEKVVIGDYTFLGTGCILLPGTELGKGCVVGAGSVVKGKFPDYSVLVGNPAKVIGDTRTVDQELVKSGLPTNNYYDPSALNTVNNS